MLSGKMPGDDKWVISSSGRHMFVSFNKDDHHLVSKPGFLATIHHGKKFNDIKIVY